MQVCCNSLMPNRYESLNAVCHNTSHEWRRRLHENDQDEENKQEDHQDQKEDEEDIFENGSHLSYRAFETNILNFESSAIHRREWEGSLLLQRRTMASQRTGASFDTQNS